MLHRNARFVLAGLIASVGVALLSASTPVFWQVATRVDFLKGDVDNLSIDNDGRLTLGPPTALVYDSAAPFLWSVIPGPDDGLFVGSGNEGKVFRIGKDGTSTTLYDAAELGIHALAAAPDGGVYVAASPDGQIYKVDAAGTATAFFKPDEKYIWALAVDSAGNVYAATGEKGAIYRITRDGKGSVYYRTRATNVVALAVDKAGNLLAGTESPGRVFRIDKDGQAFVLLESAFREIHSIRIDDAGVVYAAAVAAKAGGAEAASVDVPAAEPAKAGATASVSTEITGVTVIDVGATAAETKATPTKVGPRGTKGAVYRIQPDGLWDTIWESNDDTPYDVAFQAGGGVLIGTGGKGKIFRVVGDPPQVTLVGRAPAQQVTKFLSTPKGDTLYITSNPGKVFRLSPGRAEKGTYESDVRDAQTVSSWGAISWKGTAPSGARIELRTRSGNSQTPDETWSKWSEPYGSSEGQQIVSPKARYLQWQATLVGKDASPVLTSVTAAYLQRNLRPSVASITVYPPGNVFQKPYSTGEGEIAGFEEGWPETKPSPAALAAAGSGTSAATLASGSALGRRIFQKGLQAFTWKAEDDNDDKLVCDVLYRREADTSWKTLRSGLTEQLFVWDTSSVPNGTYVVRIVASDAPSNPPGAALTGEADSAAFDVDNTPPIVRVISVRRDGARTLIAFEVADEDSAIQRTDYSLDAARWRPVYPNDGICDSKVERFDLSVDGGAGSVVLRAGDAMGNVTTARTSLVQGQKK
jgi:hypothetical protein